MLSIRSVRLFGIFLLIASAVPAFATQAKVTPIVECTSANPDGTYTAWFGYDNPGDSAVLSIGAQNQLRPGSQERGQPTTFLPGRQQRVFSVTYSTNNLVWVLDGGTAIASRKHSGTCATATLTGVAITPAEATVLEGAQQQFRAIARFDNGATSDVTGVASWLSTTPQVATIDGAGLATALLSGDAGMQASYGAFDATSLLHVTPGLASITVTPAVKTIFVGASAQLAATATYTNGATADVTLLATWTSNNSNIASVTTTGLVSGVAAGTVPVNAAISGRVASASITVQRPPTVVSVSITPAEASITQGDKQQFHAFAHYTDGTQTDVTNTATWNSGDPAVATIDAGNATGVAAGNVQISATFSAISATATLQVLPRITTVIVTPPSLTLDAGALQQFAATAAYSDGSTRDVSTLCSWSSSAPGVASVSASGLATALSGGSAGITASYSGLSGTATLTVTQSTQLPPDPSTIAPALDSGSATPLIVGTKFLYTGSNPIQRGVAPGTITNDRVAVVRGIVKDRSGAPLSGVRVRIHSHAEFGETLTRADGWYDMAVNGGGQLTVTFDKEGYLPVQRNVTPRWQEFAFAADVVMIPLDSAVTQIASGSAFVQVARASEVTDIDGTRRATMLFPPSTTATIRLSDGSTQSLTSLSVRATEYTIGTSGREAMPADLPPQSGYTYCVELSADEAIAAGASRVDFSNPVPFYLENFLGFPVGTVVPSGYYDRDAAVWKAGTNGRVIRIVAIVSGRAYIDVNGDGLADDPATLAPLGISDAERETLASLYSEGQSLWRVAIDHFTPWDCNWPYGPPSGAVPPSSPTPKSGAWYIPAPTCCPGSILDIHNQAFGETFAITGAPVSMTYRSDRVAGREAAYAIDIRATGATLPSPLRRVVVTIDVAGKRFEQEIPVQTNQTFNFHWDGRDAYGRRVEGRQTAKIKINYLYDVVYQQPDEQNAAFAALSGVPMLAGRGDMTVALSQEFMVRVGILTNEGIGLGGWGLDILHAYDLNDRVLYLGSGDRVNADTFGNMITTVAGTGVSGYSGDGGPATLAMLGEDSYGIATAPDGTLYIADRYNNVVRRVTPDGFISTLASLPPSGGPRGMALGPDGSLYVALQYANKVVRINKDGLVSTFAGGGSTLGDGGPATLAKLGQPQSVAVGPDCAVYIADTGYNRVRRVGPDGIIRTVAGTGSNSISGDGGPATLAGLSWPQRIAACASGDLYVASQTCVRKITPDGIITRFAGICDKYGETAEGVNPATTTFDYPYDVAPGPAGDVFIAEWDYGRIFRITPEGLVTRVAGANKRDPFADGGFPTAAAIYSIGAMTLGPDGSIYVNDGNRVRRVAPAFSGFADGEFLVPSADGAMVYVFSLLSDKSVRHVRTVDAYTNAVLFRFGYDAEGRLLTITDVDDRTTTIQRDGAGNPTGIAAPTGEVTILSLDPNGYIASIANPAGETRQFIYTDAGLLTDHYDPRGKPYKITYTPDGHFMREDDPAGGYTELQWTEVNDNTFTVTKTTAEGISDFTTVHYNADRSTLRTDVSPSGAISTRADLNDGSTRLVSADGASLTTRVSPDPRFGIRAPLENATIALNATAALQLTHTRTVALTDPANPLSLATATDVVSINGRAHTSIFDAALRKITSRSPLGRTSTSTLDVRGRVISSETPKILATSANYDPLGRIQTITQGTRTTTFGWNGKDQLTSITDPLNRSVGFDFDDAGRVIVQTLPDKRQIHFGYDANGNVTSITPPARPEHTFGFTDVNLEDRYDPPVVANSGATAYTWDHDKRITSIQPPGAQPISFAYDSYGRLANMTTSRGVTVYTYEANTDRVASVTTPEQETLTYGYDGALLKGVTWGGTVTGNVTWGYDTSARLVSESIGQASASFSYDDDDLLTTAGGMTMTRDAENGALNGTSIGVVSDSYTYDAYGAVASYEARSGNSTLLRLDYAPDAAGRISRIAEPGLAHDYHYDGAGRLEAVDQNSSRMATYLYDDNGNRTSKATTAGSETGSYDAQDRMETYGGATFTYTAAGSLRTKTDASGTTTYDYDDLGNLRRVALPNGDVITYTIDGRNRRVAKSVNGVETNRWLYGDQLRIVAETTGGVTKQFVYGTRSNVPDLMIVGGVTYRIVTDFLGSVRLVVRTSDGAVMQSLSYDEFGNVTSDSNPGFQPFGFAGGLYDRATGLVRFGARDCDPGTGRWTAKDHKGFNGGDTNLYSYVHNNPVNFTDPTGTTPQDKWYGHDERPFRNWLHGEKEAEAATTTTTRMTWKRSTKSGCVKVSQTHVAKKVVTRPTKAANSASCQRLGHRRASWIRLIDLLPSHRTHASWRSVSSVLQLVALRARLFPLPATRRESPAGLLLAARLVVRPSA